MSAETRRRNESGFASVLVAVFLATAFLPLAAIGVDLARIYVEGERVQIAADAAALAGVTALPDDMDAATSQALTVAARNGYSNGKNVTTGQDVTITVEPGQKRSQLKVTITSRIANAFGSTFGIRTGSVTRVAVADYDGPAPMGSPCNTLGNEPDGTPGAPPELSQLAVPAGATCPRTPQFWGTIEGPGVYKTQGDRFSTRSCKGNEDGCSGSTNSEFRPEGYVYIIRVAQAAVGSLLKIQLYDPAYVATGTRCTVAPTGTLPGLNMNPFTTLDALTRYALTASGSAPNQFCSGDDPNSGNRVGSSEVGTVTSFGLRAPQDSQRPLDATPVPGCARQYPGYTTSQVTSTALNSLKSGYNAALATVFHEWVTLCSFTPTVAGDYYLQVRSNVALGGSSDGQGGYTGSNAVYTQNGDDTNVKGNGTNMFAVRAISTQAKSVSVAGWDRMAIFANSDAATSTFNLIRVLPAAATKVLDFSFFDAGDAAANGTIKILPPSETGGSFTGCTGAGKVNGALSNCQITGINNANGWDGKTQHIEVPIPAGYTCNDGSAGGCWFRVQVSFGSGTVTDVTTWNAEVVGEPVRLIQ